MIYDKMVYLPEIDVVTIVNIVSIVNLKMVDK